MNPVFPLRQTTSSFALPEVDPRDEAALALLGHDLRATLSDVLGGLRLIDPAELSAVARLQFERVRASGELLARLLEQGLTVMLGEAEQAPPQDVFLRRFLTDIDLRWSGRASEKGLGFALMLGADLPAWLRIDRVGLERILSNIIGNAIKYCDYGEVSCHVTPGADGGLCFVVRDEGPGFPPAALTGGQPFHRRPAGMTKPGSGMGLHIAIALSDRMGGKLTLRNLDGRGAEVQLSLPASASTGGRGAGHADDEAHLGAGPPERILLGKRVLVADDNPTSQAILAGFAAGLGAEVVVVADGVEALGRLECESFDLLVADIEMPRLSGLHVIRALRSMAGPMARLPIIAVTAYFLRSNRDAIMAAGANATLTKPLLCQNLFAAEVRAIFTPDATSAVYAPLPASEDRLACLLKMAGPDVAADLLARLVDDLHHVERGLVQAGTGPDWQGLCDQSHVLISLAGAVGAVPLQTRAEALNTLAQRADPTGLSSALTGVLALLDPLIQHIIRIRDSGQPVT